MNGSRKLIGFGLYVAGVCLVSEFGGSIAAEALTGLLTAFALFVGGNGLEHWTKWQKGTNATTQATP